jgi:hypothetical protein
VCSARGLNGRLGAAKRRILSFTDNPPLEAAGVVPLVPFGTAEGIVAIIERLYYYLRRMLVNYPSKSFGHSVKMNKGSRGLTYRNWSGKKRALFKQDTKFKG